MKNKVINAATCDAREATEESFAGFDSVTINAATLITGARAKQLMNKYPVTLNVAAVVEVPEDQDITVKSINGKAEIGPDADGTGVFLMVNGKLTIANDSQEAVKSYFRIMVNGKILMPKSCKGQFANITANGKTEYYPDGSFLLDGDTEIDDLFIMRAANTIYYCPGDLFFLDTAINIDRLLEKGLKFAGRKIIVAESLLSKLVSQFDEETAIIRVPDGTKHIDNDLELKQKTIKRYGTKLFVSGDVSIQDAEALSALEYIYVDGDVSVDKSLEAAFEEIESVYDDLKIIDSEMGYISDRPMIKVWPAMLKKYPHGVRIDDCAKVKLSEELSPEDIMEKLHIYDCALVVCSKEQEEAVNMISEDVAMIKVTGQDQDDDEEAGTVHGIPGNFFGKSNDTQMINAAEYKM